MRGEKLLLVGRRELQRFRVTRRKTSCRLIQVAVIAQVGVFGFLAGPSLEGLVVAGLIALLVCLAIPTLWKFRDRFVGVDMIIVPLAFGGLGAILGHAWVGTWTVDSATPLQVAHHTPSKRLLVMGTMLAICLPACVFLCSHASCQGRRRRIVFELVFLHIVMMAGMFMVSSLIMQERSSDPHPAWIHFGGLLGMGTGATLAALTLRTLLRPPTSPVHKH